MSQEEGYYVLDESRENPNFNMRFHDDSGHAAPYRIKVKNRKATHLIFNDSINNNTLFIDVENCQDLRFDGVFFKETKNANIVMNIVKNSSISLFFCGLSAADVDLNIEVNLLSEGCKASVNIGTIAIDHAKKQFFVNVNHYAPKTISNVELKGITKGHGTIRFNPRSMIAYETPFCEAKQNSRIVNLSPTSQGAIKPILEINNNDVEASHNAVLGSITDEEVFFLLARGLSYNRARALIVRGIMMPILKSLLDYDDKLKFKTLFERGLD